VSGSNTTFDGATTSDFIESRDPNQAGSGMEMRQMTFTAGVTSYLACVAIGGYPPPDVRLHLGQVGQVVLARRQVHFSQFYFMNRDNVSSDFTNRNLFNPL